MAQSMTVEEIEHHEEVTLNWIIPNFKKLYDSAKAKDKETFAEEKITIRGEKWMFELYRGDGEEDVEIYLTYLGTGCVYAGYKIHVKSSEGKFIRNSLECRLDKYAPEDANIEDANPGWGHAKWTTLSDLQNNGFLSDFTLHLKLILYVYSGKAYLKSKILRNFKEGLDLDSSEGSAPDFTFIFGEEEQEGSENPVEKEKIKAHRAVLSLQSTVFSKMLGSGMSEATDGEVKIEDMSPKAMRILLNFLYSGEVDSEWGDVAEELIYGANRYDLGELQEYLCDNVAPVLTTKNVMKIKNLAKLYNLPGVMKSTLKFVQENIEDFFENHEVNFKATEESKEEEEEGAKEN